MERAPKVRIKIRVKLPRCGYRYVDPVFFKNGKLNPLFALVDGKPEYHKDGVYFLRYTRPGAKTGSMPYERVGNDASSALLAKQRKQRALAAEVIGGTTVFPEDKLTSWRWWPEL